MNLVIFSFNLLVSMDVLCSPMVGHPINRKSGVRILAGDPDFFLCPTLVTQNYFPPTKCLHMYYRYGGTFFQLGGGGGEALTGDLKWGPDETLL